jgi:MoxR-like ATPase
MATPAGAAPPGLREGILSTQGRIVTVSETDLLSTEELAEARGRAEKVLGGLNSAILGQEELTRLVVTAALARGHILLEGLPGLGKTELVKALASLLGLDFRRVQFTPDLLPGDITGGHILEETEAGRRLIFHEGPAFTHLLLADEINRASPKTQSALLEAMQERRITVLGETHVLPDPFFVLATQNPIELEGTYPLPEAQLDRFLFKLEVNRIDKEVVQQIITERRGGVPPVLEAVLDQEKIQQLFAAVGRVFLPQAVATYIARIVDASHPRTALASARVNDYVRFGASPRAAISIAEAARGHSLLAGKPNVGFDDVRAVTMPALAHRLVLDYRARLDGISASDIVVSILHSVGELGQALPREVVDEAS